MVNPSSGLLFVFSFLVITLTLLSFGTSCYAETLFVFGDGLYDAGNKQHLFSKTVPANSPPYGLTSGKSRGTWSDGLTIPDYLAEFMGIPHIPPILDSKADFSYGASFAVADATVVGAQTSSMNLAHQVMKFSANKNKWTHEERANAIYLFYIGSDDYLNYIKDNPNPSEEQKLGFVDRVIAGTEEALKILYGAGGRKFAFQNLAPLGCLPSVKQEHGNGEECVKLPSQMAELHNKKLLQLLEKVATTLNGFQYTVYDYFSSIKKRVTSPEIYRFETGNVACCGTANFCTTNTVCKKPVEYLFFDGKHLTQEANRQIAHLIWSAESKVINPHNLRELLVLPLDFPVTFGSTHEESVRSVPIDTEDELLNNIESLERGSGSQWSYIIEGIASSII